MEILPSRPPPNYSIRTGKQFERQRQSKLPSNDILNAVASIYLKAEQPDEIIVTSIVALLLCAPSRISEVLSLPEQCEHWTEDTAEEKPILRLRWRPLKGGDAMMKDIFSTATDLAVGALERIRKVTAPARALAKWYEEHPGSLYLPPQLEHLRNNKFIKTADLAKILGMRRSITATTWCRINAIHPRRQSERPHHYRFTDIEHQVLAMLPRGFPTIPDTTLRYSDALFVILKNQLRSKSNTRPCVFTTVTPAAVRACLGGAKPLASLFHRHGHTAADGSPFRLSSHQMRHLLNTAAQRGGLSQTEIAKWSGRKDISQNAAYDHMSSDELLQKIREAVGDKTKILGPLAHIPDPIPISKEEYKNARVPTALPTPIGTCIHDLTMSGCPFYQYCIGCEDHVFTKTPEFTKRVDDWIPEEERLIAQHLKDVDERYAGANRALDLHRNTLQRLKTLQPSLHDPTVRDGTLIQLPAPNSEK